MKALILLVAAVISILPACAVADLNTGLVARYTFEGNASDFSGNGNHANAFGMFNYVTGGLVGGALHIVGDNSLYYANGGYVGLPSMPATLNNAFTVSLWVRDEATGGYPVEEEAYISFGALGGPRVENHKRNTANPHVLYNIDSGLGGPLHTFIAEVQHPISTADFFSAWKMMTMTYDGSTMTAFVDGQAIGSAAMSGLSVFPAGTAALGRHWWQSGSSARMSATFDEVRIYDRALNAEEVGLLYAVVPEPSAFGISLSGLIGISRGRTGRRKNLSA